MTKRLCGKCGKRKDEDSFSLRSKAKGTRQSMCRECFKDASHAYYKTHKTVYVAQAKVRRTAAIQVLREKLYAYLLQHPCVDCGEKDPVVLDFDHDPSSDKTNNVCNLVRSGCSWKTVLAEIEKCAVRCSNCHRRRTAKQFGWFKHYNQHVA
jgi:phage-related protein